MVLGSARGGFAGVPEAGARVRAPELGALFRPRAVALFGSGDGRDAVVRWAGALGARVYAVRGEPGAGVAAVAAAGELPGDVDLAVVLGGDALPVVRQLSEYKVPLAVVLGAALSADRLRGGTTRVLGPTGADQFAPLRADLDGPGVAVVAPTGPQARHLYALQELGVRVSHWALTGGAADLTAADLISYYAEQPGVGAVACHLGPVRDAPALLRAADHAARHGVPVVALASPGTPVLEAALRQYGVVPVGSPDQLRDTAALLARARPPRAEGVAVWDDGSCGAAAPVAALARAAGLPAEVRGPAGTPADVLADPAVGVLVCPVPAPHPPHTDRLARALADAAEASDKPVCVIWGSPAGPGTAYRETLLGSSRLVTFRATANCVAALTAYAAHHRRRVAYRSPYEELSDAPSPSPSARKAGPLLRPGHRLSEHAAKQLLRAYGIRVPREQLVTSAAAAVRAAAQVGYPVVLKASAPHLAHRAELGLVRVGLTSASQVRDTYRDLAEIARYERVDLDGVLVCQMVERGVEMALSVAHDPLLGPTVTAGTGGILAEADPDSAVRVPPFGDGEARAMLDELRVRRLLDGVRGGPPLDVDALVEAVLRVQRIALELGGDLAELAVDPLVVRERGQGAVALGARAVCRTDTGH